nr:papilin-like [Dromaius novaehollandiae]
MVQHSTVQHGTVRHSTAWCSTARVHGAAQASGRVALHRRQGAWCSACSRAAAAWRVGGSWGLAEAPPARALCSAAAARPGVCPKRRVLHTFAPCTNACTDDTQCPPGKKCCFTGCGLGCLTPVWGLRAGGERATPSRSPRLPPAPSSSSSSSSSDGVCSLRPVRGPCRGHLRRYFYNPLAKACQAFIYSGCGGNRNNFPSRRECQQACRKSAAQVCRLPKVPGTCLAHIPSYFYNAATRRCERFIYKGCTGNENRFASEQECRRTCGRPARAKE